jgi:hypothetical protein
MGTVPLSSHSAIVECDEDYWKEVTLKRELLDNDHNYYYQANGDTLTAQWETLNLIVSSLASVYPGHFTLEVNNSHYKWRNLLLNETQEFTFGDTHTLPLSPLDWAGRQVQEDLLILDEKLNLIAGQLCFPSGWCLDEKMNKQFMDIHGPLPRVTDQMIQSANKLLERIPAHKPLARNNWGFRVCDWLDLSSKHSNEYKSLLLNASRELKVEEVGESIYVRIEHQTLTRLPQSNTILFTIHTYNSKVAEEVTDSARAQTMNSFLKTVPKELLEYKQMTPIFDLLIKYLDGVQKEMI